MGNLSLFEHPDNYFEAERGCVCREFWAKYWQVGQKRIHRAHVETPTRIVPVTKKYSWAVIEKKREGGSDNFMFQLLSWITS